MKTQHLARLPGTPVASLNALLEHHRRYGLDCDYKATPKRPAPRYTSWKALAAEAIVEVAIESLGAESFVLFIEGIGYAHYREQARAAWQAMRDAPPDAPWDDPETLAAVAEAEDDITGGRVRLYEPEDE